MSRRERGAEPRDQIAIGEGRPLAYPFNPEGFIQKLRSKGFHPRQETRRFGEQHLVLPIDPGSYRFSCGFPGIDEHDTRYFYGNLPVEKQVRALKLDTHHARFQSVLHEFQGRLPRDQTDFAGFAEALYSVMEDSLTPDEADEDIEKMSQILERGRSACAGLTLVAGLLVRQTVPRSWFVQRVDGASADFDGKRPHDIGHNWLRISNGRDVALYDPYYQHLTTYDLQDLQIHEEDPFRGYPVQALSYATIHNEIHPQKFSGVRLVDDIHGRREAWLKSHLAHEAQISGNLKYDLINVRGGGLDMVNGCIWTSRDMVSLTLFPLHGIERLPS